MKYYIVSSPFSDWKIILKNNYNFIYKESIDLIDLLHNDKIIPICPNDFVRYDSNKLLFFTNPHDIVILNNKGLFAEFMMRYYLDYIPLTIYYNVNNTNIYNSKFVKPVMILKSTAGAGGRNVKIIKDSDFPENLEMCKSIKNFVVSEFIEHNIIYAGHFLSISGTIIDKIYFYTTNANKKIYRGRLKNYKVSNDLSCDDSIFAQIFSKLNYSGFACADFTIHNNKVCIFEINPRIGGSLVFNIIYFNKFLKKLIQCYADYRKIKN